MAATLSCCVRNFKELFILNYDDSMRTISGILKCVWKTFSEMDPWLTTATAESHRSNNESSLSSWHALQLKFGWRLCRRKWPPLWFPQAFDLTIPPFSQRLYKAFDYAISPKADCQIIGNYLACIWTTSKQALIETRWGFSHRNISNLYWRQFGCM